MDPLLRQLGKERRRAHRKAESEDHVRNFSLAETEEEVQLLLKNPAAANKGRAVALAKKAMQNILRRREPAMVENEVTVLHGKGNVKSLEISYDLSSNCALFFRIL